MVIAWTQEKTTTLGVIEPHHSSWQCNESHRCCCHGPLAPLTMEILEHRPYSSDTSPCDYDFFAKMREPLRETRYNTIDELIRAIGRSLRNINKDTWCATPPEQKVIKKGATILNVHKCCTPVNKAMSDIYIELLPLVFIQSLYINPFKEFATVWATRSVIFCRVMWCILLTWIFLLYRVFRNYSFKLIQELENIITNIFRKGT